MKDDHGRSVLMNMMVNKTEYTNQQVKEIKMLVEVHGADCHLSDNEGTFDKTYFLSFNS